MNHEHRDATVVMILQEIKIYVTHLQLRILFVGGMMVHHWVVSYIGQGWQFV